MLDEIIKVIAQRFTKRITTAINLDCNMLRIAELDWHGNFMGFDEKNSIILFNFSQLFCNKRKKLSIQD